MNNGEIELLEQTKVEAKKSINMVGEGLSQPLYGIDHPFIIYRNQTMPLTRDIALRLIIRALTLFPYQDSK